MTEPADDLLAAARRAYTFTYPLVMHYRTLYRQALSGGGRLGAWVHRAAATPDDLDIVTPCADVRYSYAWVDVGDEPWVLTVPPVEDDRYLTSQWDDLWGHVLDNVGSVNDGTGGTTVLLAAPDWHGEVPDGIDRVIRGETRVLGTLTRVEFRGADDVEAAGRVQEQLALRPLSAFLGAAPPAATCAATDWPEWHEGDDATEAFWDHARFLLGLVVPHPDDAAAWADLELLGLTATDARTAGTGDVTDAGRRALAAAIPAARTELVERGTTTRDAAALFGDRAAMGTRYVDRALGVMLGILGNVATQATYVSYLVDEAGESLDGRHSYELTFPAGQQPPVRYFWSLTAYSLPERHLVRNPIGRYTIGSGSPHLAPDEDGAVTIRLAATRPDAGTEHCWLPLAAGPTWVVLRCYGPGAALLERSYVAPVLRRLRSSAA